MMKSVLLTKFRVPSDMPIDVIQSIYFHYQCCYQMLITSETIELYTFITILEETVSLTYLNYVYVVN